MIPSTKQKQITDTKSRFVVAGGGGDRRRGGKEWGGVRSVMDVEFEIGGYKL